MKEPVEELPATSAAGTIVAGYFGDGRNEEFLRYQISALHTELSQIGQIPLISGTALVILCRKLTTHLQETNKS